MVQRLKPGALPTGERKILWPDCSNMHPYIEALEITCK